MEKFTHRITIAIGVIGALLVGISVAQGADLTEMLLLAVALEPLLQKLAKRVSRRFFS